MENAHLGLPTARNRQSERFGHSSIGQKSLTLKWLHIPGYAFLKSSCLLGRQAADPSPSSLLARVFCWNRVSGMVEMTFGARSLRIIAARLQRRKRAALSYLVHEASH